MIKSNHGYSSGILDSIKSILSIDPNATQLLKSVITRCMEISQLMQNWRQLGQNILYIWLLYDYFNNFGRVTEKVWQILGKTKNSWQNQGSPVPARKISNPSRADKEIINLCRAGLEILKSEPTKNRHVGNPGQNN